jgi:hypothetical protein
LDRADGTAIALAIVEGGVREVQSATIARQSYAVEKTDDAWLLHFIWHCTGEPTHTTVMLTPTDLEKLARIAFPRMSSREILAWKRQVAFGADD